MPKDLLVWDGTGKGGQSCVWHDVVRSDGPTDPLCQGCVRDGAFGRTNLSAYPPAL